MATPPPKRKKKKDMFEPLVKWKKARKMAKGLDPSGRLSDLDIDIQIKRLDDAAFKKKKRKKPLWT